MLKSKQEWIGFAKYVAAGATSVVIQFGLLKFLVDICQFNETLSSTVAYIIASIALYLMMYYWAFQSNGSHAVAATRYCFTSTMMLGVNFLIFWVMTNPLGIWYMYSQAVASTTIALLNYVVNRFYTFK